MGCINIAIKIDHNRIICNIIEKIYPFCFRLAKDFWKKNRQFNLIVIFSDFEIWPLTLTLDCVFWGITSFIWQKRLDSGPPTHLFTKYWFNDFLFNLVTGTRGTNLPPLFSNFLFTNLFSIKFLYFFIISSLFSYFNLFVLIFVAPLVLLFPLRSPVGEKQT